MGFVAIPQFLVGILLFAGASYILPFVTETMLSNFKACGGIITLAVGLKIADIKRSRVLNILPSLVLVFPFSLFCKHKAWTWGVLKDSFLFMDIS